MKILWHSHSPLASTGYGIPTAMWVPELEKMGHDVAVSSFTGQHMDFTWHGRTVLNTDDGKYGATFLPKLGRNADLIITLMDIWVYSPDMLDILRIPVINWIPVDTSPLSVKDEEYFRHARAYPVAMSEHGKKMLNEAGIDGGGIPYAFDPAVFYPDEMDRKETRRLNNLDGLFVVGINAANVERKAWPEQLLAYASFWREHQDEVILLANTDLDGAINIPVLASRLGLPPEAVRWTRPGVMEQKDLASWYRSLDVLCSATYAEGFCMPAGEAQACGTEVIVTNSEPVRSEVGRNGIHVDCEPTWHGYHLAWWHRPSIGAITNALEYAFKHRDERKPAAISRRVQKYAVANVAPMWQAMIESRA